MMKYQQQQDKIKAKQIAPKKVWWALTEHQQQQFARTIEAICQQLASRLLTQQEGHDAAS